MDIVSELKPQLYELFPSLVYHTPFLTKEECEMYVKCLDDVEKSSLPTGIRPFLQTTDKLHLLNDTWKELSDKVIDVINSVADHQRVVRDSFYNTNMWANIGSGSRYFHQKHSHPNSFFSSILTLSPCPPRVGTLTAVAVIFIFESSILFVSFIIFSSSFVYPCSLNLSHFGITF